MAITKEELLRFAGGAQARTLKNNPITASAKAPKRSRISKPGVVNAVTSAVARKRNAQRAARKVRTNRAGKLTTDPKAIRPSTFGGSVDPNVDAPGLIPGATSVVTDAIPIAKEAVTEGKDIIAEKGGEFLFGKKPSTVRTLGLDAQSLLAEGKDALDAKSQVDRGGFDPNAKARFTGQTQDQIAENAFAEAFAQPIERAPGTGGVASQLIRPRSAQQQAQAVANAQRKASFLGGIERDGVKQSIAPQGLSDTAGVIGAPGSRFTGIDDATLARFGIASSRNKADPAARAEQNRLADANKGRFTGSVESRRAATQGIESRAIAERRASEADALARQQSADTLSGQQGAQDFKSKQQRLKIRDEGRQKQVETMLSEGDTEGAEELKRQFGYEDQMDTDGSGDLSQQERQKATREMQGILAQFEAMTPEQQAKNKNHPAYMKALAMRKILQGQAEAEAKNIFGF